MTKPLSIVLFLSVALVSCQTKKVDKPLKNLASQTDSEFTFMPDISGVVPFADNRN